MGLQIRNFITWIGQLVRGGTAGSVLFVDANGAIGQDNANFFWDNSNHRLGLGVTSPAQRIELVSGNILLGTNGQLQLQNTNNNKVSTIRNSGANGANIELNCPDNCLLFGSSATTLTMNNGASSPTNTTSVILDLQSTNRAFAPPRMSTSQKNAISSPSSGMMVYDTTLNKLCIYGAASWETVTSV